MYSRKSLEYSMVLSPNLMHHTPPKREGERRGAIFFLFSLLQFYYECICRAIIYIQPEMLAMSLL